MAQIETFEDLPIVDPGGRYLIAQLRDDMVEQDAKKISFPNNGADFGNSGDQLRSLGDGGVEWAAPGMPTYEQTEQAISDWLNDHPEATTTVTDGAITESKLNTELKESLVFDTELDEEISAVLEETKKPLETVETSEDLITSTSEYVQVVNNDSRWGINDTLIYDETTATLDTVERDNGTYLKPSAVNYIERNSSAPITELFNCAASYIGSELTYGGELTLFSPVAGNVINCSSFVEACMLGITKPNSRYDRGTSSANVFGKYATDNMNKDTDYGYLYTWQLADWFLERKQFYEIKSREDIYKLCPGDILFGSTPDLADNDNRIYQIDHCMLVLQVFKEDGSVLIAQGGGTPSGVTMSNMQNTTCKMTLVNFIDFAGSYFVGFARPNYGIGQVEGFNITKSVTTKGLITVNQGDNDKELAYIRLSKKLESGKMYYFVASGKLPVYDVDGGWLVLTRNTPFANIVRAYRISFYNGVALIPFVVPDADDVDYQTLIIRVVTGSVTSTQQYEIETAAIYEGYCQSNEGFKPIDFTLNVETNSFSNFSYIDNNGKYHFEMTFELDSSVVIAANNEIQLGTIQNHIPYVVNIMIPAYAGRISPLIFSVTPEGLVYLTNPTSSSVSSGQIIRVQS